VLNFSQQYKSDLLHSIVPALGAWRLKPKFLQISNATQLRIFSCLLFCVCAKHGRLQNQKRLGNTDIKVPFRRILKILQPNVFQMKNCGGIHQRNQWQWRGNGSDLD